MAPSQQKESIRVHMRFFGLSDAIGGPYDARGD